MKGLDCNAHLVGREDLTCSLRILRVQPDHGPPPDFEAGQFMQLGLPAGKSAAAGFVRRSYSIASPPGWPWLEVYLQLVPGGAFSELLRPLRPGARLWLGAKAHGHFTLAALRPGADLVAVATGTGIAPFLSMLRSREHDPPWNRFRLLHGARLATELGYRGLLEARAASDPRFGYLPTLTREPLGSAWQGARGRVQRLLEPATFAARAGFELDPARCSVMLCGNPGMIGELRLELTARGFVAFTRGAGGNLHFERFW